MPLAETVEARSGVLQFFSSDWRLVEANASYFSAESFENYVARGLKTDPMDELRLAKAFLQKSGW